MQDPNHSAMSTLPATAPPLNATKPDNTIPQAPPLIRPNKCCQIRYINGKRICPENTKSPEECMQEAQMKAERRKQELANVAMEAVKAAAKRPEKPEECIKTVDPKEQQCLVKKLQEKAKKKPKYVVSNNSNEVRIFNGNDLIFIAMRIQSHYAKHEPKKAIPSTVKNYDNAIMFNEAGDVVATKTKKNKPKPQDCICPTPSEPPVTKEGLLSECFKPTCKTAGILSEIVSNSTVTNVKDDQKDDKDKDKDDGKSKIKPQDKK
ncbi:polar tube protein 2 [Vairimorpha apis BRL 01]|uniref:Polar tube protein 2 n=2 Tax=Vairimorpha apis TaxID=35231 RepID=T0LCE9_9MICR|nr:polar tube protein 2 [Vairimorpha apis BRL 01]